MTLNYRTSPTEQAFADALARLGPGWRIIEELETNEYIVRIGPPMAGRPSVAARQSTYEGRGLNRTEAMQNILRRLGIELP